MFRTSGLRVMDKGVYPTIVAMGQTPIIYDKNYRELTIREVARLQSFPDNYQLNENKNATLKQLGNAVNVDVVYQVAKQLLKIN